MTEPLKNWLKCSVILVAAILLTLLLSGCGNAQQNNPESTKCRGAFGIGTAFEPTTLNFNNVEYEIEEISFDKFDTVKMNIAWTPKEESAAPELSKHIVLYDADGAECKRSYPTAAGYDEELNQPKRKAGTKGEYAIQYSGSHYTKIEGGETYSLALFDEFNNEISSFDFKVDPSTFQGIQEEAKV